MANKFIELVQAGRIADEAALKRAFRAAAKRVHPDALAADSATGSFIALRSDYEEALAFLGTRCAAGSATPPEHMPKEATGTSPVPRSFSRSAFYESLENLLARGFPRRPRAAYPRSGYDASRELVLSFLAGRDRIFPEDRSLEAFLDFEAGYTALAGKGTGWLSVDNDPVRSLYFILSDIVLYHETGFAHTAAFARNVHPDTQMLLRRRGETRPLAFLALLVADLAGGPACVDY